MIVNKVIKKITTFTLLVIICALPFSEAFHHHKEFTPISKKFDKQKVIYSKCIICDFVYHKLSSQLHHFNSTEIHLFVNAVYLNSKTIVNSVNSGYVHLSGNKGPPANS